MARGSWTACSARRPPIRRSDDLRQALLAPPDGFVQTFTENLLSYALGRRLDYRDMPRVRQIVRRAAADGYRFKSIVLGVVSSDAFLERETQTLNQAPAGTTPAGGP